MKVHRQKKTPKKKTKPLRRRGVQPTDNRSYRKLQALKLHELKLMKAKPVQEKLLKKVRKSMHVLMARLGFPQ